MVNKSTYQNTPSGILSQYMRNRELLRKSTLLNEKMKNSVQSIRNSLTPNCRYLPTLSIPYFGIIYFSSAIKFCSNWSWDIATFSKTFCCCFSLSGFLGFQPKFDTDFPVRCDFILSCCDICIIKRNDCEWYTLHPCIRTGFGGFINIQSQSSTMSYTLGVLLNDSVFQSFV